MTVQSKKNAEALGKDTNRLQTIEECGELIKALCKYNRTIGIGQKTETSEFEALTNLIEEVADVSICLEQLVYLMGIEEEVKNARKKAFDKVSDRYKCFNTKEAEGLKCKHCAFLDLEDKCSVGYKCTANKNYSRSGSCWKQKSTPACKKYFVPKD